MAFIFLRPNEDVGDRLTRSMISCFKIMFLDSSFATSLAIMTLSSAEKVDRGRLVACVASVSNRVIARKLELFPPPSSSFIFFFALVPAF